jgi:hypothetical protein
LVLAAFFADSPAWVLGAFPSRASSRARSNISFSGIDFPPRTFNRDAESGLRDGLH